MNQVAIPSPLFDTLAHLDDTAPACVQHYLAQFTWGQTEYTLAIQFLQSYAGSNDTFTAYRRDIERFIHWCWLIKHLPLKKISRNELRQYLDFINAPPQAWIATQQATRFIVDGEGQRSPNPAWRPFVAKLSKSQRRQGKIPKISDHRLSQRSVQALLATLSTFFNFFQQEDHLDHNPVQLVRQKNRYLQRHQQKKVTRRLSHTQWTYVIETTELMAAQNARHERTLFMMSAFYLLGLRISELAQTPGRRPCMGDFAPDKNSLWWLTTIGKGNKVRDIAVPDAMLETLKRYRQSLDLSPLPSRGEETPLLSKLHQQHLGLGTRQVRNLVQQCFDQAIYRLEAAGQQDEAQDLGIATVHWLRHTAISADIAHRPREHVRDDAGHENAATTEQYIDVDRRARHASAKHKSLDPDKKMTDNKQKS